MFSGRASRPVKRRRSSPSSAAAKAGTTFIRLTSRASISRCSSPIPRRSAAASRRRSPRSARLRSAPPAPATMRISTPRTSACRLRTSSATFASTRPGARSRYRALLTKSKSMRTTPALASCLLCPPALLHRSVLRRGISGVGLSTSAASTTCRRSARVTSSRRSSPIPRMPWSILTSRLTALRFLDGQWPGDELRRYLLRRSRSGDWRVCLVDADHLDGRRDDGASLQSVLLVGSGNLLRQPALERKPGSAFQQRGQLDWWRRRSLGSRSSARLRTRPSLSGDPSVDPGQLAGDGRHDHRHERRCYDPGGVQVQQRRLHWPSADLPQLVTAAGFSLRTPELTLRGFLLGPLQDHRRRDSTAMRAGRIARAECSPNCEIFPTAYTRRMGPGQRETRGNYSC